MTAQQELPDVDVSKLWTSFRPYLKPVIVLAVSVLAGFIIVGLVGAINWSTVADSFAKLTAVQFVILALVLLVRQALNAVPLTRFVPGLSLFRSVRNDVTANVVGTITPPPGDVVIRVAMFRTWGINAVDGMAGVTLNTFTFYAVRFTAPVIGALLLAWHGLEGSRLVTAVVSGALAATIVVSLILVVRGDRLAALVGRTAGQVVKHLRPTVDPDQWADAVVDFRGRMAETLRTGLAPALAGLLGMVVVDGTILLLAVRFVGIGSDTLPTLVLLGAFFMAYPLTIMPLSGLGFLDPSVLAIAVGVTGVEYESAMVAALAIWRVYTLLGPLVLGSLSLLAWKVGVSKSVERSPLT